MTAKQRFQQNLEELRAALTTDWQADGVRVTDAVVTAVDEVLAELRKSRSNWYRVATLLSCKSYLCGALLDAEPFCEDRDHNESVLSEAVSVYAILGGLQFRAAMLAGVMPAGMTEYTAEGKREEAYPRDGESPTMRNMALADRLVRERCEGRDGRTGGEE